MKKILKLSFLFSLFLIVQDGFSQSICCQSPRPGIVLSDIINNTTIPSNSAVEYIYCVDPNTTQIRITLTPTNADIGSTYTLSTITGSWYIDCGNVLSCPPLQNDGSMLFAITSTSPVSAILNTSQNPSASGVVSLTITSPSGSCCTIPLHIRRSLTTANSISGDQCIPQGQQPFSYSISCTGGCTTCGLGIDWDFPKSPNPSSADWKWSPIFTPTIRPSYTPGANGFLSNAIAPLNSIANPNAPGGFIRAKDASGCGITLQLEIFWKNIITGDPSTQTATNPSGSISFTPKSTQGGIQKGVPVLFTVNPVNLSHIGATPKIYYRWTFHSQYRPVNSPAIIGGITYNQTSSTTQPPISTPSGTNSQVWYISPTGIAQTEVPWIILQAAPDPTNNPANDYGNGFVNVENYIASGTNPANIVCKSSNHISTGPIVTTAAARMANPVTTEVETNQVVLQPNPASNFTTLNLPRTSKTATYTVFNEKGLLMIKKNIVGQKATIYTADWPSGTYNVVVKDSKGRTTTTKLVVSK